MQNQTFLIHSLTDEFGEQTRYKLKLFDSPDEAHRFLEERLRGGTHAFIVTGDNMFSIERETSY